MRRWFSRSSKSTSEGFAAASSTWFAVWFPSRCPSATRSPRMGMYAYPVSNSCAPCPGSSERSPAHSSTTKNVAETRRLAR